MSSELTLEQAIKIATSRTLPPGYKPEDYFGVDAKIPLKIASMIVKDALHLVKMSRWKSR